MYPQKFGKEYFSGNYHVKFGNFVTFSGKCHVKFGHFMNFSYNFQAKNVLPARVD